MSDIRITIGGRLDRSVHDSFVKFREEAEAAGKAADRVFGKRRGGSGGGSGGGGGSQNPELVAARAAHAEQSRLNREIFKQQVALARQAKGEELKNIRASAAERLRLLREEAQEHIKSGRLVEAAVSRAQMSAISKQQRAREREIDRLATRTSHRATRFIFPRPEGAIGYARRTANDLMRGLGVDMTLSGGVSRAQELEKQAMFLSSKGYFAGAEGPAGQRVDYKVLMQEARSIANAQALNPASVQESQAAYVGLTGDLATARALMSDLAAMSGATGSDMVDLGRAAGAMGNAIGEGSAAGSEKAKVLLGVMRVLASQGKLTAIEMDTLAKHMPKLAGASRMYGDVAKTMAEFGALGQLSMGGGAWNAASATTAMAGFTAEISGAKGQRELKKIGVSPFDAKTKMLRSPIEIIREIIEKTGADPAKLSKVVTGTRGGRMVNWMAAEYRRTGNWDSTNKRVNELMNAGTLSEENIAEINQKRVKGTGAKAQVFQNQLDEISAKMTENLIPSLERVAPVALKVANVFAKLVSWAAENPWKAAAAALSLAITRAFAESIFRGLIDRTVKTGVGGSVMAQGGAAFGLASGGFTRNAQGSILKNTTLGGSLAAAGTGLGLGLGVYSGIDFAGKSQYDEGVKTTNDISKNLVNVHGKDLSQAILEAEAKLKKYQDAKGFLGGMGSDLMNLFGAGDEAEVQGLEELINRKKNEYLNFTQNGNKLTREDQDNIAAQKMIAEREAKRAEVDAAAIGKATADGLKGQTIQVRVMNAADLKSNIGSNGPSVGDDGRGRNGK